MNDKISIYRLLGVGCVSIKQGYYIPITLYFHAVIWVEKSNVLIDYKGMSSKVITIVDAI